MPKKDKLERTCSAVMRSLKWYCWPLILAAVALAGVSVYYSLARLTVSTSRNDLIASNKRLIQLSERISKAFGGRDGLVVVAENVERRRSVRFAEALAAELRRYPDRFPDLFYRLNPEYFKAWALLYPETADLQKLKDNLQGQKNLLAKLAADPRLSNYFGLINEQIARAMIGNVFTGFLDEGQKQELPDVSLLNASLKQLHLSLSEARPYASPLQSFFPGGVGDLSEEGYFFTDNDRFLMFLVTPQRGGYTLDAENLSLLREVVGRVQAQFPGTKVGVTGPDALEADEMSSSMRDIALATWLSLLGQMGLLIFFLRGLRRPLVEVLVLVIGLCWTFGVVTLTVGHLNLLSMIFAPLMLGLSIDYGIHWFCRLEEEDAANQYRCTPEALSCSYRQTLPGVVYAGLVAMVSFLPLAFMGFRGLSELGLIMTVGIFIMLVATMALAPSLVMVSEHCVSTGKSHQCPGDPPPFLDLSWSYRGWIVAVGAVVIGLGVLCLFLVRFDLNPLHLQNPRVESVVWEMRLMEEAKYSTSYGEMIAESLKELQTKTDALKKLPTVSHVESVLSFLPARVEEKQPILREIQPLVAALEFPKTAKEPSHPQDLAGILSRINFKMDEAAKNLEEEKKATKEQIAETHSLINQIMPQLDSGNNLQVAARLADFERHFFTDLHDKWHLLQGYLNSALTSPPMTLADLPPEVQVRFISGGTYLLRAFSSQDVWDFAPLGKFVQSLWQVDPDAVGDPVLLYFFTTSFRNSILWAAGIALIAIAALLTVFYRSLTMAMLALIPLWVGAGLTLILMWLLGLAFNQANVLFLPLILGEGIEFGIIILTRWQSEETARAITLPASTAKGVALAALTTTLGFGSLMVSSHRGTFSLGLLATVGSLSVLVASLTVLPAFLNLVKKGLKPVPTLFHSLLGAPPRRLALQKKARNQKVQAPSG